MVVLVYGFMQQKRANAVFVNEINRAFEKRCQSTGRSRACKSLSDYTDHDCKTFFRFDKQEIRDLLKSFRLTEGDNNEAKEL
eukprot:495909-Hanusia_phi.AAC.1